ncbi:MAG TPA: serine/threonine-protein kinase [Streptomyces sp.]|nr:serine/threonine-protein kinase [Streptomyces sp.]
MGEVFAGRYELVDPIGRGGVGAVWRAWDHRRRRYVAAKVLQQSDAHSLLRFVREQALRIDHPHVLAPASWAADDDKVLFTMDLVAGGSLVHLVGDYGPLPPAFVCTLLDQLLSGLTAVHAEGVVHRDVKPANVLLEATGTARPRLRLSDFGIAVRLGEPRLTQTDLVVGTPGYLAPEQIVGADPGFPADLFAVGLVALYLLEGAKPDAKALVRYFTEHGTPGAPQNVPEPLWQVVATLLQPDPDARFRTATGARKALASAAELLPRPGPDDEVVEIFDQIGPLPPEFAVDGPVERAPGVTVPGATGTGTGDGASRNLPRASTSTDSASGPSPDSTPGSPAARAARRSSDDAPPPPGPAQAQAPAPPRAPEAGSQTGTPPPYAPGHRLPASAPGHAADPRTPPPDGPAPAPRQPPSMSDTGSFHLPPPQSTATTAATPRPSTAPPNAPDHLRQPYAAPAPFPALDASTASYTAQAPPHQAAAPPSGVPVPGPAPTPSGARSHRARRARRPGPPAKVAVPLLLLALACYAVGFWALTRV